ncbi:MAG: hypothetical protein IPK30_10390 [Cellvibrionales bacterium]|jgi:hypothetical protein|nr:hypothetical protein [Cellvibrionales bacterium]
MSRKRCVRMVYAPAMPIGKSTEPDTDSRLCSHIGLDMQVKLTVENSQMMQRIDMQGKLAQKAFEDVLCPLTVTGLPGINGLVQLGVSCPVLFIPVEYPAVLFNFFHCQHAKPPNYLQQIASDIVCGFRRIPKKRGLRHHGTLSEYATDALTGEPPEITDTDLNPRRNPIWGHKWGHILQDK